jgi:hypothetical protein
MEQLARLTALEGPYGFLREPGRWLWGVACVGALIRLYLLCFTEGTLDVVVWDGHAREVLDKGLVGYYHGGTYQFNHPPLMGTVFSLAHEFGEFTGVPFRVLLRAPFAILDAGTAALLVAVMGTHPYRYVLGAVYWLHPLALIFSAYHGNTDPAIAFFLLLSILFAGRNRPVAAGIVLGVSLWIKVPGVLALPAIALSFPTWKARSQFVAAWGATGIVTYVPVLFQDARVVVDSVFLYSGLKIQTTTGVQVWGLHNFYPALSDVPIEWRPALRSFVRMSFRFNTVIVLVPIAFVAWCHRRERSAAAIAKNVCRSYAILYGLTNFWAFQYLAWSLPLWLTAGWRFAASASIVCTVYIYGLYAWLCGSPILTGTWDFIGRPDWPPWIIGARNASNLFFLAAALWIVVSAALVQWRAVRAERELAATDDGADAL